MVLREEDSTERIQSRRVYTRYNLREDGVKYFKPVKDGPEFLFFSTSIHSFYTDTPLISLIRFSFIGDPNFLLASPVNKFTEKTDLTGTHSFIRASDET